MKKAILFTHTDLDGAGCAVLFKYLCDHRGMTEVEYSIFNADISKLYETVTTAVSSTEVDANTEIVFAALCCGEELMKRLTERFKTIRVFDHHVTNSWANVCPGVDAHVYEHNSAGHLESGTSILWSQYRDELNNPVIVKFTNAVRSYDNFEFKVIDNPDAIRMNKLFSILGMEAFCTKYSEFLRIQNSEGTAKHSFVVDAANEIIESVEIIDETLGFVVDTSLKLEREKIDRIVNGTEKKIMHFDTTIDDERCVIFNVISGMNMSDLGAQYLNAHPEYSIFIWFDMNRKGFSYRSTRDDIDVSVIASKMGGGGHPKAAGSLIPQQMYAKIVEDISSTIRRGFAETDIDFDTIVNGVEWMKYLFGGYPWSQDDESSFFNIIEEAKQIIDDYRNSTIIHKIKPVTFKTRCTHHDTDMTSSLEGLVGDDGKLSMYHCKRCGCYMTKNVPTPHEFEEELMKVMSLACNCKPESFRRINNAYKNLYAKFSKACNCNPALFIRLNNVHADLYTEFSKVSKLRHKKKPE